MNAIDIFRDLAIILITAKLLGVLAKRFGIPQVVGEIVAGLLIGPNLLGIVGSSDYLDISAEIGCLLYTF